MEDPEQITKCNIIPVFFKIVNLLYIFYLANRFNNINQAKNYINEFLKGNETNIKNCVSPKYFSKKNTAPCHMSVNFLTSIFVNDNSVEEHLTIYNFSPSKLESGSVFTISIDRWYDIENNYNKNPHFIHHMFFIKNENVFYLIHTFGQHFTYTLEELTLDELEDLLDAIDSLSTMDEKLKNIIINRYFNYSTNIINECVIRKSQPNVFTNNVNYPVVNIVSYGISDIRCLSKIFDSIFSNNENFIIDHIYMILQEGSTNQRYRAKKILREYYWFKENQDNLMLEVNLPVIPLLDIIE